MDNKNGNHNLSQGAGLDRIGPTAWGVAYDRAVAEIKYAQEIFDEIDAVVKPTDPLELKYLEHKRNVKNSPQFEARYKLINRLLAENKTEQILEIAAGLAPRGLEMTDADPSLCYVEMDLPVMAEAKRKIIGNLISNGKVKARENLFVENGDALDPSSYDVAVKYFINKPLAVVHEGLLRYMNFTQKGIVAKHIKSILEKFGGVWITSDITLKGILYMRGERKANREFVKAMSGINVEDNAFESEPAAIKFFEDLGFTVERHSFLEALDELVSPKKLGLSLEETKVLLSYPVVFVMRLKK